jgi:hypothetical protein
MTGAYECVREIPVAVLAHVAIGGKVFADVK